MTDAPETQLDSIPKLYVTADGTPTALPERLRVAIGNSNAKVLVLKGTVREARDSLREDRRLLAGLGLLDADVKISVARGNLIFTNGSRVDYLGGDGPSLEQGVRGLRAHYIDGADLISEQQAAYVTISQA